MRIKINKVGAVFSTLVLGSLGLFLSACPQSDGTPPGTPAASIATYAGTSAPGDTWTVLYDPNGTFTIVNTTTSTTYAGTYSLLASGYTQLTITSPSAATGYAMTIANTATLVWLGGASSPVIIAAATESCPAGSTTTDINYVRIPSSAKAMWGLTDWGYGTSTLNYTSASAISSTVTQTLFDGTSTLLAPDAGWSCAQGVISKGAAQIYMTNSGIMIRDDGPSQGGTIGVARPATAMAGTIATDLASKTFVGFQWNKTAGAPVTEAIKGKYLANNASIVFDDGTGNATTTTFTCNTASINGQVPPTLGCILGYGVTPATDVVLNPPGLIPLTSEISNGMIAGKSVYSNSLIPGQPAVFMFTQSGGKYIAFGATYTGSNNINGTCNSPGPDCFPYNFLVMEQ